MIFKLEIKHKETLSTWQCTRDHKVVAFKSMPRVSAQVTQKSLLLKHYKKFSLIKRYSVLVQKMEWEDSCWHAAKWFLERLVKWCSKQSPISCYKGWVLLWGSGSPGEERGWEPYGGVIHKKLFWAWSKYVKYNWALKDWCSKSEETQLINGNGGEWPVTVESLWHF